MLRGVRSLVNGQHQTTPGDLADEVDLVLLLEACQRLLIQGVEDQDVACQYPLRIHDIEERLGQQRHRDAVTDIGTLFEQRPPSAQNARQRGVEREIGDPYRLGICRAGRHAECHPRQEEGQGAGEEAEVRRQNPAHSSFLRS